MKEEWVMHAGQQPRKVSFKNLNGRKYELQNEMEKSDIELEEIGSDKKLMESEPDKMEREENSERKLIGNDRSNREL